MICYKSFTKGWVSDVSFQEYIIRVQRGPLPDKTWHVYKRYNDFISLHNLLQVSGLNLPLPPKKLIGNMGREFIAERQTGLQVKCR
jgi:PX domain-containing protein kinase-like protein